jgi:hypothetical protein
MRVRAKGGGGGSGTVQTDGVTIQGDGSAGNKIAIKAVQTDATLSGAGTVASKLAVAPLTAYTTTHAASNALAATANTLAISAITITYPITFSKLSFDLFTADAAHNADFGFYNAAGILIANIGAQVLAASGVQTIATVQGSQTIFPGVYFFAFTSDGSVIAPYNMVNTIVLYANSSFGASVGGALPATIVPPAFSPSVFNNGPFLFALS